jgi:hypothetical protein
MTIVAFVWRLQVADVLRLSARLINRRRHNIGSKAIRDKATDKQQRQKKNPFHITPPKSRLPGRLNSSTKINMGETNRFKSNEIVQTNKQHLKTGQ